MSHIDNSIFQMTKNLAGPRLVNACTSHLQAVLCNRNRIKNHCVVSCVCTFLHGSLSVR